MPGRDPEAARRSKLVAVEVRNEMRRQGLTGAALKAKIEELRGEALPNQMWISRRLNGGVNLVQPVRVVYGPTNDLDTIAQALGIKVERLVRVVNRTPAAQDSTTSTTAPADQGQDASTESAEQ